MHGGKTPRSQAKAARTAVEREAREALAGFSVAPVTNPLQALAEHAAIVIELRDYLRDQVDRLESLRYQAGAGEQIRAELSAYQAALRDTTNVLAAFARLNIDQRLAAITEAQISMVLEAIEAALNAAAVRDPGLRNQGRRAAAVVLRAAESISAPSAITA
jgi:hypothetical protein